jgi:homoserine kinase
MQQVTVRVPASTSNLGPGFDCLGVALRLYNDVTISRHATSRPGQIIRAAARLFFDRAERAMFSFSCSITGDVPRARGLGSSATVRLGILHGLNALTQNPLDRCDLFGVAARLEGHFDNAAPAAFGGFNVVAHGQHHHFKVSPRLQFVLLIPNFEIPTVKARSILPDRIPFPDAIESCGNACAITAAFASGDYEKLRGSFRDRLHQPYRKKLTPFLDDVIVAGEKAGALGGFLSGSGSTIVCVTLRSPEKVAAAMLSAAKSVRSRTLITQADNRGAGVSFRHESRITNH